jgi:hypothetical protein
MPMSGQLGKLVLTAHIASSVGWLGAVAVVLVLGVAVLTVPDPQFIRGGYLVMEPIAWFVLVPLSLASLVTGLVQSLGTRWGLFRHYWVLFKLLINVFASVILLMYTQTLSLLAAVAVETTWSDADLQMLRSPSVVVHAGAALLLLVMATTLSVYKPKGLTPYGQRRQRQQRLQVLR